MHSANIQAGYTVTKNSLIPPTLHPVNIQLSYITYIAPSQHSALLCNLHCIQSTFSCLTSPTLHPVNILLCYVTYIASSQHSAVLHNLHCTQSTFSCLISPTLLPVNIQLSYITYIVPSQHSARSIIMPLLLDEPELSMSIPLCMATGRQQTIRMKLLNARFASLILFYHQPLDMQPHWSFPLASIIMFPARFFAPGCSHFLTLISFHTHMLYKNCFILIPHFPTIQSLT